MESVALWIAAATALWLLLVFPLSIVVGRAIGRGDAILEECAAEAPPPVALPN